MAIPLKKADDMRRKAGEVAALLGAVANERRLLILCALVEAGEATVGELAKTVGLSQSAMSQHLARMRDEDIVAFRRVSQTAWYRIADMRVVDLFVSLHRIFCHDGSPIPRGA